MLQLIGCNHRTCPLSLRERLVISTQALPRFLQHFRSHFHQAEAVLLSTCNRFELYTAQAADRSLPDRAEIVAFLARYHDLRTEALTAVLYEHRQNSAVRHLFAVAASLDSLVLGESQILRQVKSAYEIAKASASTGTYTNGAFQAAMRTARRIAKETNLHRHRVSLPGLAIGDCVRQVFEHLGDKSVLVIGGGEMALETLEALKQEGGHRTTIINRDFAKARQLADRYGGQARPFSDLPRAFTSADMIITATAADHCLVGLEEFRRWEQARYQRNLLIVDLGVPRDIDPRIGECLGVFLYSIEDLPHLVQQNPQLHDKELSRAHTIVEEEAALFSRHLEQRAAVSSIRRLQASTSALQATELRRLFDRFPDLNEAQREAIRQSLRRFSKKILHPIVTGLKEEAANKKRVREASTSASF